MIHPHRIQLTYFSIAAINPGAIVNSSYEIPKLLMESNSACRRYSGGSTPSGNRRRQSDLGSFFHESVASQLQPFHPLTAYVIHNILVSTEASDTTFLYISGWTCILVVYRIVRGGKS